MPNNKIRVGTNLSIRAAVQSSTFNEANRTVEVIFGSDTPVRMQSWDGPFFEILSFQAGHVDMSRMENGAPVLDNHDRYGSVTESVLGVVENARTDGTKGYATLRFSKGDKGSRAMADVQDGIIRNVSVGYKVTKYERTKADKPGVIDTLRAIEWQPYEVSFVPVGADAIAQVRSNDNKENNPDQFAEVEFIFTNSNQNRMLFDKDGKPIEEVVIPQPQTAERAAPTTAPVATPPTENAADLSARAIAGERARVKEINETVDAAKLPKDFARKLIEDGTSIDESRKLVIAEFAKQGTQAPTNPGNVNASVGRDIQGEFRQRAEIDALVMRAQPSAARDFTEEQRAAANQYRGRTLLDIARGSLQRSGVNTDGMDKMELAKRAISSSSSDFPVLLEGTNRRVLLAAFQAVPDTWRQFCKTGSVGDFRVYKRIRQGTFSNLDTVNENSEYKTKPIPDGEKEQISAATKGNIVNISRVMIVNDDLQAFTDIAAGLGRSAARSIEADVYAMFALNGNTGPTMGDGVVLFHTSHGNIATTAAAPSVAAFDAARVQMAIQKDPSQNDFLDLRPSIWLGPIGLGGATRVVNNSQYDTDVSNKFQVPNKVVGLFTKVIDTPRLTSTPWYLLANPSDEAVFEVAFLDGVETPFLEQHMPFQTDGMAWKIRLDYGVAAIGWRGIIKNAGA